MTEVEELDARNVGAEIAADRLLEIARTGQHPGVFGGPKMEAAAQAILKLYADVAGAEERFQQVMDALGIGETWKLSGVGPVNLAQAVRAAFDRTRAEVVELRLALSQSLATYQDEAARALLHAPTTDELRKELAEAREAIEVLHRGQFMVLPESTLGQRIEQIRERERELVRLIAEREAVELNRQSMEKREQKNQAEYAAALRAAEVRGVRAGLLAAAQAVEAATNIQSDASRPVCTLSRSELPMLVRAIDPSAVAVGGPGEGRA